MNNLINKDSMFFLIASSYIWWAINREFNTNNMIFGFPQWALSNYFFEEHFYPVLQVLCNKNWKLFSKQHVSWLVKSPISCSNRSCLCGLFIISPFHFRSADESVIKNAETRRCFTLARISNRNVFAIGWRFLDIIHEGKSLITGNEFLSLKLPLIIPAVNWFEVTFVIVISICLLRLTFCMTEYANNI